MHSSTITAFLLPLLLSSVLAVPTPVQTGAASRASPPTASVSEVNGLTNAFHPVADSLIGRQDLGQDDPDDTSPAALDPTAGINPDEQDDEEGDATIAHEIATGQVKDPLMCHGSCKRSLKGRQEDPEVTTQAVTDPNADLSPQQQEIDADKAPGVSPEQADIDASDATIEYAKSQGQDQEPGTGDN